MENSFTKNDKIYVAGHNGLVGSAITRSLREQGYKNVIFRTREELNLLNHDKVNEFFKEERPDYVFLAAARCGGINDNIRHPVQFLQDNLTIQNNIIEAAHKFNVKKLMFLASSCIFPRNSMQPIKEDYLLTGSLEPTNQYYAVAKIAGVKLCEAYRKQYGCNFVSVNPCNVYGPKDNFSKDTGHVIGSLINRFHDAKVLGLEKVDCWGAGTSIREFIYVEDLAEACIFIMENYDDEEVINVGWGTGITIKDLAEIVKDVVGYEGEIIWDITKPDGMPKKVLCVEKLDQLGWRAKVDLEQGIKLTYDYFKVMEKN